MSRRPPSPRVLCAGIAVRDFVFRVKALPPRGTKTNADQYFELSGGNALNAAVGIVRLGGRASYAGPIGDMADINARHILDDLAREGIGYEGVVHVPGATTPLSSILLDAAGERTIATYRDPKLSQARCPDPGWLLDDCAIICADNRYPTFTMDICTLARQRNIPVLLDADRAMPLGKGLLTISTHVIFSAEGLRTTTNIDDPGEALRRIAGITHAFVGVTIGHNGMIWLDGNGAVRHMPSFEVETIDTLGAGDVFHGALALAIAEGQDILHAMRFASAAAALKCTRLGGAFAAPLRKEVEALLAQGVVQPAVSSRAP
ncbi:MAG: sugar kinase [Xanthobacteraceae bacterium]|nr:MAG: sugar kinase [Xanthobacteraceae bacterium]